MKINLLQRIALFSAVFALLVSSCSKNTTENVPAEPVPININSSQRSLVQSSNAFAFDLFRRVLESSSESDNVIISPMSVSVALSMTLNGAAGATQDSMLRALRVENLTPGIINSSYRDLSAALLTIDKRVLISLANSVWTEKNFIPKVPFKDVLTTDYNAESKSFDIMNMMAYKDVNSWIEEKTNGLITKMLDHIDDNTVMLLINAIYFKGKWQTQFNKSETTTEKFYMTNGATVDAPMMKQKVEYKVLKGDGFIFAELPYGQGNYVMDIFLPDQHDGITTFVPSLTDDNFNLWLGEMGKTEINLTLPRFKNGYKKELKDILSAMGMGLAFSDNADFSNIADLPLKLSMVLHQALIETNEEGTEAAAATIVGVVNTAAPPPPLEINVDHPFVYLIREISTNSILFMGKVADPLSN